MKRNSMKIKMVIKNKIYVWKDGKIIEIKLEFQRVKGGVYELRTMYPEGGDGVYRYVNNYGWLKYVGKKGNKWMFEKE